MLPPSPLGVPPPAPADQGALPNETNVTCTACAGTLLLEFGALSRLTGNPTYMTHAEHSAAQLFAMRSRLGLLGSSLDVQGTQWHGKESTIGPGTDSYYEYLLKVRVGGAGSRGGWRAGG